MHISREWAHTVVYMPWPVAHADQHVASPNASTAHSTPPLILTCRWTPSSCRRPTPFSLLLFFPLLLACYRGFRLRCQGRAGHKKKTTHTSSRVVSSWYWPASSLWSMQVPAGFLGKLWSFVSFVPFFILLLLLGSIKGNNSSTDWPRLLFMNCLCVDDLIFWFVVLCSVLTIVYVMCGSGRCKWFTLLFCSCPSRSGYGFHRILWELCGYYWPLACAFHLDILLCS